MKAGKTNIEVGTKIKTTKRWAGKLTEVKEGSLKNICITGTITHAFGLFGSYDYGAIAGIRIDKQYQDLYGEVGNLFKGDFVILKKGN